MHCFYRDVADLVLCPREELNSVDAYCPTFCNFVLHRNSFRIDKLKKPIGTPTSAWYSGLGESDRNSENTALQCGLLFISNALLTSVAHIVYSQLS